MEKKKIELLIENGIIVTIDPEMRIIEKGWLAIDKGSIIEIGSEADDKHQYLPVQTINAAAKIVMPGFINTHTHIPMAYFKGLADDLPLHVWLNEHIWPKETKMVNDEFVYHSSLHGIAELIKNGIVMFNDMYFKGEQTAKAAIKAGVRAVIGEGILDFPVAGYNGSEKIIDYTLSMIEHHSHSSLIDIAFSPHAIYTCGEKTLKKTVDLAREHNVLLHTHLAETKKEVEDCFEQHKKSPASYLNDLGFWSERCVAAHSVWLSDEDIEILAAKKVNISVNTESNLKLASGFMPVKKCLENGINITLGTDGVASNNNLSIIEEMGTTAKVHKALNDDPTFLPAAQIIKFPTINAANALGKGEILGSLEAGKRADIIIIDTDNIESLPMYNPYSQLVYNLSSGSVRDVIIDGKVVMYNRLLLTLDEDEIKDRAYHYHKKMKE